MNQNLAPQSPADIDGIEPQSENLFSLIAMKYRPVARIDVPFAAWKAEYLTGNHEIDQEHQELFELVNSLHNAMLQGKEHTQLKLILADLASHTIAHFQQEEMLMESYSYPRYERHKQSHAVLKNKVVDLLQKFNSEKSSLTVAVTQFLTDWLVHHIQGEDRKLTEFIQEQQTGKF